jgi:hypothetical protein
MFSVAFRNECSLQNEFSRAQRHKNACVELFYFSFSAGAFNVNEILFVLKKESHIKNHHTSHLVGTVP